MGRLPSRPVKTPIRRIGPRVAAACALLAALQAGRALFAQGSAPPGTTQVTVETLKERPVAGQPFTIFEINLEMRPIPAGVFVMGSPKDEPGRFGDETQHTVRISKPFWLGRTPVTHGVWRQIMGSDLAAEITEMGMDDPDPRKYEGNTDRDVAMYYVSWQGAVTFCRKLTEHARARGSLPDGYEYGLPTEAQWEYACRAGTKDATYAGPMAIVGDFNAPALDPIAWYGGNSAVGYRGAGWFVGGLAGRQHPGDFAGPRDVGLKQPNPWGLCDMLGNVWQWCSDWYGPYPAEGGAVVDPTGPGTGTIHVHRGGSWYSYAASCRAASRSRNVPGERFFNLGFRAALVPVAAR